MTPQSDIERILDQIILLPDEAQLQLLKELLELHAEDLGLIPPDDKGDL